MTNNSEPKVITPSELRAERDRLLAAGQQLVFTNGCFDILHRGHVTYLAYARSLGDALAVGLNTDRSVKRLKGDLRPIHNEQDRAYVLGSLRAVDYVVLFDEDEPKELLAAVLPQVLVKGADWASYVSGRDIVESHGGHVVLAEMVADRSTTRTIERIVKAYGHNKSAIPDSSDPVSSEMG